MVACNTSCAARDAVIKKHWENHMSYVGSKHNQRDEIYECQVEQP